uniref:DUF4197 domain-containing protein n=1 Tax=Magnetococcus massalia (strain MO-1) TaxID=451514 RepID=A0A1S7LL35_MAGMO|nr:conserved exported protein of unknown function [Candidatus Magnetococcus massalia]
MKQKRLLTLVGGMMLLLPLTAHSGWMDMLDQALPQAQQQPAQPSQPQGNTTRATGLASLTQMDAVAGLKQALRFAADYSIKNLGASGGFLDHADVRIPMPEALNTLASFAGGSSLEKKFVTTMNRAAEKAVPATTEIFVKAIDQMSMADAKAILAGGEDAATRYFRDTQGDALKKAILPIVTEATQSSGATSTYKQVSGLLKGGGSALGGLLGSGGGSGGGDAQQGGGLGSLLGGIAQMVTPQDFDLDQYVTDKSLDGLFLKMAQEEKKIRTNPVARSTDLLRKVFDMGNTI